MKVEFFCTRWGSEDISWDEFCKKMKDAGYDGVEYGIPHTVTEKELDTTWNIAQKYGLGIIAQHYDTYEADFSKHFDLYNAWLQKIKLYPVVKINSQTGKDFFSFEQNKKLIEVAASIKLNIVHETHRNKFAYAAHVAQQYLEKIPGLLLTLDVSHWVCVSESYLEDQPGAIQLAIERTDHIHARVGYPEGPQVPDPRISVWKQALDFHLEWWDRVAERMKKENKVLTITPEFGPYPYMVHVPSTRAPVCNQWDVNVFMMKLLRQRYQEN